MGGKSGSRSRRWRAVKSPLSNKEKACLNSVELIQSFEFMMRWMGAPEICSEEIRSGVNNGSRMLQRRSRAFRLGEIEPMNLNIDDLGSANSPIGRPWLHAIGDMGGAGRRKR